MNKPRAGRLPLIPASDIAAQLAERAEQLCRELLPGGHREGPEWRAGSTQGDAGRSLGVHLIGVKAGLWSDFATGESGDLLDLAKACLELDTAGAIGWAKNWLGIGDGPAPRPRAVSKSERRDEDTAKRTEAAVAIWRAARPAPGTPVEKYLRHRGITIQVPPTLRYHHGVRYERSGILLPCMVAAVQAPDRKVTAIHRTYLRDDGQGKAGVSTPKMALGPIGAGAVRLGPAGPALGLVEGVETGLSVMQLFDLPVWCSLSASRLDRLWLPPEAQEVHVFGDNGTAGHEAAERAAKAYQAQGRRVVVRFPPAEFDDFNDLLCAEAAA